MGTLVTRLSSDGTLFSTVPFDEVTYLLNRTNKNGVFSSGFDEVTKLGSNIPTNNLLAFYNFNGNANDSSGNGRNLSGSYSAVNGIIDQGGQGTVYYNTNLWDIYASPQSYTVAGWFYIVNNYSNGGSDTLFGCHFNNMGTYIDVINGNDFNNTNVSHSPNQDHTANPNGVYFHAGIPGGGYNDYCMIRSNTQLSMNTWYHVAVVHDAIAKTLSLYVNGQLESSASYTSLTTPTEYNNYRGFALAGSALSGGAEYSNNNKYDVVGLWNTNLSSSVILNIYKNQTGDLTQSKIPAISQSNSGLIVSNYFDEVSLAVTPSLIPSLYAWYDANASSTLLNSSGLPASNGDGIYTWKDRSGNGINLTNQYGTAPVLTNNILNGLPVARFTATGKFNGSQLRGTHNLGNGSITYIVVYQWRNLHRVYSIDAVFTLGSEFGAGGEGSIGSGDTTVGIGLHGLTFNAGVPTLNKFYLTCLNYNSNTLQESVYVNRTQIGTTQTANSSPIDTDIILGSWVYNSGNNPEYFSDADIAEVIIYNRSLAQNEIDILNQYINIKYGI